MREQPVSTPTEAEWVLDHNPAILLQAESRGGEPNADGVRWIESRPTGLGMALCSCGYTTGLISRGQLPGPQRFADEHPPFALIG